MDIRQAYFEWKKIGGSHLDLKVGRQQISYGDQRIFGPGLWGNTGRYAWDAAMLQVDTSRAWVDAWVGRPIENRPEIWPNREFKAPTAFVVYGGIKKLPFRLDVFYAGKYDGKAQTTGSRERATCGPTPSVFSCRSRRVHGWTSPHHWSGRPDATARTRSAPSAPMRPPA